MHNQPVNFLHFTINTFFSRTLHTHSFVDSHRIKLQLKPHNFFYMDHHHHLLLGLFARTFILYIFASEWNNKNNNLLFFLPFPHWLLYGSSRLHYHRRHHHHSILCSWTYFLCVLLLFFCRFDHHIIISAYVHTIYRTTSMAYTKTKTSSSNYNISVYRVSMHAGAQVDQCPAKLMTRLTNGMHMHTGWVELVLPLL